jgi:hypothetical protein
MYLDADSDLPSNVQIFYIRFGSVHNTSRPVTTYERISQNITGTIPFKGTVSRDGS